VKRFVLLSLLVASTANAQDINKAISSYKSGRYEDAASQFYAVLRFSDAEGDVVEAQYGLASSFQKLGLPLAALKYYEDIVKTGNDHPYFTEAVRGLVDVGEALDDDLKTPQILDSIYTDENRNTLQKMNTEVIQRVHFVLGRFVFNRGNMADARGFLKTVKSGNPSYPHAQYMLGLIRLGVGAANKEPQYQEALEHFENARAAIPADVDDEDLAELRDLATLGVARTNYEQAYALDEGDPKRNQLLARSLREYKSIPRFSQAWQEALFERAWAHTVASEYGRALGALHSLKAPYFEDAFYPEGEILRAIVYYYNCQWDRVREVLEGARATYEPMSARMKGILEKELALDEWYPLLQRSLAAEPGNNDGSLLPWVVAKSITSDPKFVKMESFLREIDREGKVFEGSAVFQKSDMGRDLIDFAADAREAYLGVVGKFLRQKVTDVTGELTDITTRASLVSLETQTAEIDWLEQGRETQNIERKRLPRPFIPDDTFQFWWFRDEYWVDELGYYEFTIKTECFE
jgi:tetratricopeptide (TPR) repeat protein